MKKATWNDWVFLVVSSMTTVYLIMMQDGYSTTDMMIGGLWKMSRMCRWANRTVTRIDERINEFINHMLEEYH